jgi:hypothetical protein
MNRTARLKPPDFDTQSKILMSSHTKFLQLDDFPDPAKVKPLPVLFNRFPTKTVIADVLGLSPEQLSGAASQAKSHNKPQTRPTCPA